MPRSSGLPPRAQHAPAYLPVDRAFTLTGHGTIVTGTLMQGSIAVERNARPCIPATSKRACAAWKCSANRRERVDAGARVAVNLAGVPLEAIARGSALVAPEIRAQSSYAVRFQPLPEALELLRRRMPVRVHLGAGESFGTLVFAARPNDAATGGCDAAFARSCGRGAGTAFRRAPHVAEDRARRRHDRHSGRGRRGARAERRRRRRARRGRRASASPRAVPRRSQRRRT